MGRKIKIHYYAVSSNNPKIKLDALLAKLSALTLDQRDKIVGRGDVRLEIVEKHQNIWFMHLTASRVSNWPGVGRAGQLSSDLKLDLNAELTENTYAAFNIQTGILVLQYTQRAVRAGRLFAYLDQHTGQPNTFLYTPVLNNDAMQRYAQKHAFTEIEAVIDNVTKADEAYFKGSSVASTVRESVQAGVTRLAVTFKVDARVQHSKIQAGFVSNFVKRVIGRKSDTDKLVVTGRDQDGTPLESIDLLADVKSTCYDEREVTLTPGRRYRIDDMRRILFDALRK